MTAPRRAKMAGMASATSFIRGVREGSVTAVSRPLHAGRTVIVVQTDVHDSAGRLAAQVTQTQAVLAGPS
jgi:1,4-dihydroxy-2-naphthoyl-CoA hydrolase